MAKLFIIAGAVLLIIGIALFYFPSLFSWFGNMPGDLRYEGKNTFVFVPLGSMLIISLVLSLLTFLLRR